MGKTGQFTR